MRAIVLEAPGSLTDSKVSAPEPADGEALIRVTYTGICGTDSKIYSGGIPAAYPVIMGHEIAGEIVAGETRDGAGPGTRVLVDPVLYCGTCRYCRAGQTYICPDGVLMGREINGGFAEFVTAPSANLYTLPDTIKDPEVPLIQVLTTVVHGQNIAAIEPGETVVILGLGVTGQMHVQMAKAAGANPVIGVSRNPGKRDLAKSLGADIVADHGTAAKNAVLDASDGLGADLIIESVGLPLLLAEAMDLARPAGRIVPFGIYADGEARLPFYQLYFKELRVLAARAAEVKDFPAAIEAVQRGDVALEPLLSHTLHFTELERALAMLSESDPARLKIVLEH